MVKAQRNKTNIRHFPLIEQANLAEKDLFNAHQGYTIPEYINANLLHTLRHYQDEAIRNYHYTQTQIKPSPQHVLFNMATGSGKTDLMAGLILYLYQEYNYRNFLFTVNTNSVLMKTKDNLVNKNSDKYLYQDKIEIDGTQISIVEVERFPRIQQENTIYIKLSSVQKVSDDLFVLKENTMGLSDYERQPVVILADEAHHYSASTKSEKEAENTWESAINKILNVRNEQEQKNLLLEFTATVDFDKEVIYDKYRDKVVYRYPLSKFMFDGYSKQVKRIETSASDEDKMLNVVLLSQFRKYRAYSEGVTSTFKPVILFKSPKVAVSLEANQIFNQMIENLNVRELIAFIKRQQLMDSNASSALSLVYDFYLKNEDDLGKIIREIKNDFDSRNVLNANDTSGNMLEKGQYQALNTLENPNNLYRVVFAVAKLTEGWDVLNLYDIVRIEKEAGTNKKATMAEAQLIGRGARYYPFEIEGQKSYQRRFDNEPSNKQLFLETLHYHTMNEPQYLKQLVGSLKQMDLPTGEDKKNPPIEIKVKSSFKQTEAYKNGKIYYNEVVDVEDEWFDSIDKYGINHQIDISRSLNYGSREVSYQSNVGVNETKTISLGHLDERYIKKAIQRLDFYQFEQLKKYIPLLPSMKDFIYGKNWLNANKLNLFLTVPKEYKSTDVTPDDILNVVIELLKEYEVKFKSGYVKQRGTNKFIGYRINEYLTNYNKRVPEYDTANLFNETMQKIAVYEIEDDFYVYEKAIVNKLEYELIERVKAHVNELKEKYQKSVYLLRMDENMHRESAKSEKLKLHQYGSRMNREGEITETHLQGFQPDFILFLEDSEFYFQIFIEPKGMSGDRFISELWKQDLLLYMTDNQGEMEFEANEKNVRISGLKFYTRGDGQKTMEQLSNMVQIKNQCNKLV
ncbi:DEAD/DEAH box helicase family protein [Enterococcus faecalis]|uniref:Helicase ATP-binding domain-containing protein n=1 Tax=Enterococcus sulfureus ATCC 49903 TaxID=1140003 RepID=S0KKF2_9ENTE|nr:DEAD/DEAH box helicase family protein [Enterococcus sulfureus]EGO5081051.1 DEAD/DEAH box helicase family protein [Enterococcus faecalis]EGO6124315.1 DEAD/DEAH box helicase family protein [Enterococcus faecalis]EGO7587760.1 DEAD/DEAH box helicase family protein [Enterococcus faecalis]EGO7950288.1 DEAD/DEAH box helicase family protein [Enterococcus faecalis]EGO8662139.1 restriction endonuclease [Enterococcus faecalis]